MAHLLPPRPQPRPAQAQLPPQPARARPSTDMRAPHVSVAPPTPRRPVLSLTSPAHASAPQFARLCARSCPCSLPLSLPSGTTCRHSLLPLHFFLPVPKLLCTVPLPVTSPAHGPSRMFCPTTRPTCNLPVPLLACTTRTPNEPAPDSNRARVRCMHAAPAP